MGFLEETDFSTVPSIPEFYKGKNIFITGGSGFMGKVLIEKLLYSCSDINKIYLLLRNKNNIKSEDRLEQIYSSACFDRLKKEKPTLFKSKVFFIAGDVLEMDLENQQVPLSSAAQGKIYKTKKPSQSLSKEDRTLLVDSVNIVFHVAASVRFDDTLQYAVKMNLRGTKEMVKLARDMTNLSAFIHISTAYSNTNRDPIEEIMYPPLADIEDTLAICENIDEHTLRVLTPKYLGKMPNTYAFSKQLAEHVVYETMGQLPAVIFRPSIVVSSSEEPLPGWIDNFNGPIGLGVAGSLGLTRSLNMDPDITPDYVPVDMAIKSLITAAWIRGIKDLKTTDDIPIYNCCASKLKTQRIGEFGEMQSILHEIPLGACLWYPNGDSITTSKMINYIKTILFHLIPAIVIDTLLRTCGHKPLLVKIQRRIYTACMALKYYTDQQWTFDNKNFILLRSCIKEEDLSSFYYDIEKLDKYKFAYNASLGARRYLLKQKDEDIPKHRVHHQRMFILDKLVQFIFWGCLVWSVFNWSYVQYFF